MKQEENQKPKDTPLIQILIACLFISSFFLFSNKISLAQEVPSLDEKAQEVREAVEKKVQETIQNTTTSEKVGISGLLEKITGNTINVTSEEEEHLVAVDDDTVILNSERQKSEIEDLTLLKPVIVLGYLETDGKIQAKRIVQTTKLNISEQESVFGQVTDLSRDENVLTIKNIVKNETYLVDATKAIVTKKTTDGVEKSNYEGIEKDDKIIAIGTLAENGQKILKAIKIYIIPASTE